MIWRFAIAIVAGFATNVLALEDDESFSNYESIVSELRANADRSRAEGFDEPDWSAVAMSGGLGLTGSYVTIEMPEFGVQSSGLLKGFEAHVGFNLFRRDARVEAAFRNFAHDALSDQLRANMRELEAGLVFLPSLQEATWLRMGIAASGRFVQAMARLAGGEVRKSWGTPYYSLILGFERKVSKAVNLGPDISYHGPLDASSYSKSSWDASFRLNASF